MNQLSVSKANARLGQRFKRREMAFAAAILFLVSACGASLIAQSSAQGNWRVEDTVDQMTGHKGFRAILWADASSEAGRARAKLTATCTSEFLQINIVYAADFDTTLGFKEIQPDSTVFFNQIHTPKPRVDLRVGIDEAPVAVVSSEADHPNELNLYFTPGSPDQAMANMDAAAGTHSAMPLLRVLAAANSAGTIEQIYKAHLIKVELPLANGDAPILRIFPHDSGFQALLSRCKAAYALAPPALVSGRAAWRATPADASPPFVGNLRPIPIGGARFVLITELEAQDILARMEKRIPLAQSKDYAPLIKTAEVLPPGTVCAALEMKNRFASGPSDPFSQIVVSVPVGRGSTVMVKLADGRLGLIPHNDFFSGYTDTFRRAPDPIFAPPLGSLTPGTQGPPAPLGNNRVSAAPGSGGQPSGTIKLQPTEVTVGPGGLQLLPLPKPGYSPAFTVPPNTVLIIDAKSPEGWIHVVAKQSKEHWSATPPYYGWARPGSLPAP